MPKRSTPVSRVVLKGILSVSSRSAGRTRGYSIDAGTGAVALAIPATVDAARLLDGRLYYVKGIASRRVIKRKPRRA